jgi:hypothetical protein
VPLLNYECRKGHQFEREGGKDRVKCPECNSLSEILWVSPRSPHRQLQTPIVMWRYKDGSLGVAGGVDSKTPRDAERVEIRSVGDYRRYAKELNGQMRETEERREDRFQEKKAFLEKQRRSNLAWMMGQESDPAARDIYRAALEWKSDKGPAHSFREFFSTAMEMDRSNYE